MTAPHVTRAAQAQPMGGSQEGSLLDTSNNLTITPKVHKLQALTAAQYDQRFRRQIEAIHRLGPCVLAYFAEELTNGDHDRLRRIVKRYSEIDCDFVAAYGGDRFPPALRAIEGGAS